MARIYKGNNLIAHINAYHNTILSVNCVLDKETSEINQEMQNNYDYAYKSNSITSVVLTIPDGVEQGYCSSISFNTNDALPTLNIIIPEGYNVNYIQRGYDVSAIILSTNHAIIISIIYDGINIYVYEKETELN